MDTHQRLRAGEAIQREMDAQGLTLSELSRQARVAPVTLRDLISGKRWPWTSSRTRIERALDWPTGRIAKIARGEDAAPTGRPPTPPGGGSFEQMLEDAMEYSGLPLRQRYLAVAHVLQMVEDHEDRQRAAEHHDETG